MKSLFNLSKVLTATFFAFALFLSVAGQATTADILGTVEDSAGRVVPGATVTATNVGTNQTRTATTNDSGNFAITNLQPGRLYCNNRGCIFQQNRRQGH